MHKPKSDIKNEILELIGKGVFESLDLVDYEFKNPKEITEPLQSTYSFEAKNFVDNIEDIGFMQIPYMTGIQKSVAISSK